MAIEEVLKCLPISCPPPPPVDPTVLAFKVESRKGFAYLSMYSRHAQHRLVSFISVKFSDSNVDDEAAFLAITLRKFKQNGNRVDELHLQYGDVPFSFSAKSLFETIADLRIPTVTLRDGFGSASYPSYGRRTLFSCTISPVGKPELNTILGSVCPFLTHLTIFSSTPAPQVDEKSTVAWTKQSFPFLRVLTVFTGVSYMSDTTNFLARHPNLASFTIQDIVGVTSEPFRQPIPFESSSSDSPLQVSCPREIRIPDNWGHGFFRTFRYPPNLEQLLLTPTHREHPSRDLDCLQYIGEIKDLRVKTRVTVDGRFYLSCHSGAKYSQVESLTILPATRDYSGLSDTRREVSAEAVEVC